ncbi:hypothetical protein L208DRAFT_1421122 [Tricholoma matsutake]|nr:hypothetical protein L208DRAFT_1421122 [Tricholoma matsutake 945]
MHAIAVFCLSFVASALAYLPTFPSTSQGWTDIGPQLCQWQRVNTDPQNFTAVLVNQGNTVTQVLAALVDGTLGEIYIPPPSAGWPVGPGFRVNFAQDAQHLNALLAQSSQFSIVAVNNTLSSTTNIPATTVNGPTTYTPTTLSPSSTSDTNLPSSAASPSMRVQSGFISIFALIGFLLA